MHGLMREGRSQNLLSTLPNLSFCDFACSSQEVYEGFTVFLLRKGSILEREPGKKKDASSSAPTSPRSDTVKKFHGGHNLITGHFYFALTTIENLLAIFKFDAIKGKIERRQLSETNNTRIHSRYDVELESSLRKRGLLWC